MKMVIDRNDVILGISESVSIEANGIKIDDIVYAVPVGQNGEFIEPIPKIIDIQEIPEGILPMRYCFTEDKGFYENTNYKEPMTTEQEIEKLKEENIQLKAAVEDLTLLVADLIGGAA